MYQSMLWAMFQKENFFNNGHNYLFIYSYTHFHFTRSNNKTTKRKVGNHWSKTPDESIARTKKH